MCKEDGSLTTSYQQVADEFVRYYENLLGTNNTCEPIDLSVLSSGPFLSQEQAVQLIRDISDQEIIDALNDIGDDKSPGPDGFSSCFFKKSWPTVGDLFSKAVKELFSSDSLLKQINHTVIALVLKSSHSPTVGDYRPIACCNVTTKVISKIMAARLAPILGTLVDRAQSAFSNEYPFTEMNTPGIEFPDNIIVGLGLMVVFFLSLGIYPNDLNAITTGGLHTT